MCERVSEWLVQVHECSAVPIDVMPAPRFSLIIPARDESARIAASLAAYADAFVDSEVIVVLNGCTDDTKGVALSVTADRPNVRFVHIDHPVGKGGAVRAGFLTARAPVVGYVDADGSTPPEEIRRIFSLVEGDYDAVIGSRWKKGADVVANQPLRRRIASRFFNALVRLSFGLRFTDTQCGAKAFKRDAIREINGSLEVSNFAFDIDVLIELSKRGRRILEVPTIWRDVDGSRLQLASASRSMFMAVLRLRLRHSLFRSVIPLFDRLWPTSPLRVRDGLAILILSGRDPKHPHAGGIERYLFEVGKRLAQRGNRVHWLCAGFAGAERFEEIEGISITRVGNRLTLRLAAPLHYLKRFRDRFDVIVDVENGLPFLSPLFSLKPKLCLIFGVHQRILERRLPRMISSALKGIESSLLASLYAKSRFVVVSEEARMDLASLGVAHQSIDVAHCGVDEALAADAKSERPTILYVGRLVAYKRVDAIVRALPEILRVMPEAELVIAGSGDQEQALRQLARKLGVASSVRFEGFVSETRKAELFAGAWVFAMPAETEGWGMTVAEAQACGTPAIAYAVSGIREAIVDGESGLLVPDGLPLAPALLRLLTNDDLRARLSRGALRSGRAFSWDRTTDVVVEAILREMSGQHSSFVRNGAAWEMVPSRRSLGVRVRLDDILVHDETLAPPAGV